jgi:hypothetical protein
MPAVLCPVILKHLDRLGSVQKESECDSHSQRIPHRSVQLLHELMIINPSADGNLDTFLQHKLPKPIILEPHFN